MRDMFHNLRCDVLTDNPGADRFYMDMSVYEIRELTFPVAEDASGSLIWRGLYLAVDAAAAQTVANQINPFRNFLN